MKVFFPRRWWTILSLAVFGFAAVVPVHRASAAQSIFDVAKVVMNSPAMLTRQVLGGLFTSVARAGSRLVAVGQDGRVVISGDNGRSWRQVETPTSVTLTDVAFASDTEGWAVGQMAVILHTVDGGEHWALQFDGFRVNQNLLAAAQAAVAAQPKDAAAATYLQEAQQFVGGGPSLPFLTVLPLSNKDLVVAGGFGLALESHDGGATWQSIVDQVPNPNQFHIYAIIRDGAGQFWAGEQGLALSRDASGNFKTITTPFQGSFFGALRSPRGTLILYGLQGTILRSSDDGLSWAQVPTSTTVGIDTGIALDNGNLLLADEDGHLLLSDDDGKTFSLTQVGEPVVGLVEARNSDLIASGPLGLEVVKLSALGAPSASSFSPALAASH